MKKNKDNDHKNNDVNKSNKSNNDIITMPTIHAAFWDQ